MTELEFVDLVSCLMRVVWAAAAGKLYLASMGIQVSLTFPQPVLGDRYVFWPPGSGSGSVSHMYGSGSFYHRANMVRKPWFLDFYCFVTSFWLFVLERLCKYTCKKYTDEKIARLGAGSIAQRHGSTAMPTTDQWFLVPCTVRYLFILEPGDFCIPVALLVGMIVLTI